MLEESSDEWIATPPTIQALLAARLDQLDPAERTVLEAAAVEGEVFHLDAVRALTPDEPLTAQSDRARPQGVRPARPCPSSKTRTDSASATCCCATRPTTQSRKPHARGLHERYANWLEQRGDRLDAFVGYHLEQAYHYRLDLRDTGAEADDLAQRASARLEAAATVALEEAISQPPSDYSNARRPCHLSPPNDAHGS